MHTLRKRAQSAGELYCIMKWLYLTSGVGLLTVGLALAGMDVTGTLGAKKPPANLGAYTEQQVIDYLAQYEASEHAKRGKYTQVLANKIATDGTVQIPANVKSNLPPMQVHVYDGPNGKGYQVIFERAVTLAATSSGEYHATQTRSIGYGPEAKWRTWDWQY